MYGDPVPAPTPPGVLQLAGHPLRWQLLGALARSDRSVSELTDLVGHPQNLVSYHLGKLRDAALVTSRRSSFDRRDAYYTLHLDRLRDALAGAGAALHPGLAGGPAPQGAEPAARVLFLCTGNSARSQVAEALARSRSGGRVEARSAGSHPKALHPLAVRAMAEVHGIDISAHRAKHLEEVAGERFDRVVTLCDRVREVCPELPGGPEAVHWSTPDPAGAAGDDDGCSYAAFRSLAEELDTRVAFLLADLAATQPHEEDHP